MAKITPIVWTAEDVELGLLTICVLRAAQAEVRDEEGNVTQPARAMMLRVSRSYRLVDGEGRILAAVPAREVKVNVGTDQIPAGVLSALQQIDAWTRERALEHAGLVQVERVEEPI